MPRLLALALLVAGGARAAEPDPAAARIAAALAELERDARDPRGLVPLATLRDLEPWAGDLGLVAAGYARAAERRDAHPEVRALARLQLAAAERARGNLHKAAVETARLGFLRGWHVAGPFDDEGKRGHDAVEPPELRQDLGERFAGKVREVGWRPLPAEATADGFVHVGAVLRPAREVTVYALAVVDAAREERARLYVGASGAVKVWIDGDLVLADPAYHAARLDQLAVGVSLRKGPNRILVKVSHAEGRLGFYARLARASGEPLPLREVAPPLPPPAPRSARAERAALAADALAARVREAAAAGAPRARLARLRHDLAVVLDLRRAGEARERRAAEEARRAALADPAWVDAQLLAARLEEDANRRREHLEAALRAAPSDPRPPVALARHRLERGEPQRAVALLRPAVAAAPGDVAARIALADALEAAGLPARARVARLALADAFPHHPPAVLAAAGAARSLERGGQAASLLRKALGLRFDDQAARASLVRLLLDRREVDGALSLLAESIRLEPATLEDRLRRAELLAGAGRVDEAEAAFAEAAALCPEEPEVLQRRGEVRLRAGRDADALRDFHAALELRPQNVRLKELVRALEPARERFERPYLHDAAALAAAAPAPEAAPGDDALVLADLRVTRVHPSGLSSTYTQLVVKVLTERGAERFRSHSIGYAPDRQEVRVERARVLRPDGTVLDGHQENDRSASEPWYRLYYDTRVRTASFPALAPGDVVELALRRDDVAGENLLSDYFGELVFLADTTRRARVDYVLLVPERRRIHAAEPRLERVERSERKVGDGVVEHRWTARDVPAIRPEPGMPGWSEVAPFVHVSTYASWEEVQRFWWGLVREQIAPTPEVRRVARELAERVLRERGRLPPTATSSIAPAAPSRTGAPARPGSSPAATPVAFDPADPEHAGDPLPPLERDDALAIVRAVHAFVVTNTRYVGLEIGVHGFKPYRVDEVLDRRFGDCKDKASLTWSLLDALGIESRLVLLRMKRLGRVPDAPASLAVFNHAILHVPKLDLWLDGTATWSGSGDLPAEDRGATVLVVNPGGPPWFGVLPEARPDENRMEARFDVALAADGSARVRGESRVAGVQAPSWRRAYQAERNRRAALEQAFSRTFPGLEVKEVATSDLGRLDEAVDLAFTLDVARFAERDGEGLRFLPFGNVQSYVETWAPLSSRTLDAVVGEPYESRFAFSYRLPPGWEAQLPPADRLETPLASFDVAYRREPGAVVAEGRVRLEKGRVSAADYGAFRDAAARLDRALSRPVRLRPSTAAR
jgi:tetratricopeptide (TPR) repeat protein